MLILLSLIKKTFNNNTHIIQVTNQPRYRLHLFISDYTIIYACKCLHKPNIQEFQRNDALQWKIEKYALPQVTKSPLKVMLVFFSDSTSQFQQTVKNCKNLLNCAKEKKIKLPAKFWSFSSCALTHNKETRVYSLTGFYLQEINSRIFYRYLKNSFLFPMTRKCFNTVSA